jgi:hypothetical protein
MAAQKPTPTTSFADRKNNMEEPVAKSIEANYNKNIEKSVKNPPLSMIR